MKKHKQALVSSQLPGWTPFKIAPPIDMPSLQEMVRQAKMAGVPLEEMKRVAEDIQRDVIFINSRYQVNVRRHLDRGDTGRNFPTVIQLSIKRRDRQRVGPERYRDFLRIKNEIVGPLHEAFEIYPSMERNVDTANQYYIWAFEDPTMRLPLGFMTGKMSVPNIGEKSVNTPFDEGDLQWMHLNKDRHAYEME